jgi:hypothetical protein
MRYALAAVTVAFTGLIAVLTVRDIMRHGVNWLDVLALLIVALFAIGIVGALLSPPDRR